METEQNQGLQLVHFLGSQFLEVEVFGPDFPSPLLVHFVEQFPQSILAVPTHLVSFPGIRSLQNLVRLRYFHLFELLLHFEGPHLSQLSPYFVNKEVRRKRFFLLVSERLLPLLLSIPWRSLQHLARDLAFEELLLAKFGEGGLVAQLFVVFDFLRLFLLLHQLFELYVVQEVLGEGFEGEVLVFNRAHVFPHEFIFGQKQRNVLGGRTLQRQGLLQSIVFDQILALLNRGAFRVLSRLRLRVLFSLLWIRRGHFGGEIFEEVFSRGFEGRGEVGVGMDHFEGSLLFLGERVFVTFREGGVSPCNDLPSDVQVEDLVGPEKEI